MEEKRQRGFLGGCFVLNQGILLPCSCGGAMLPAELPGAGLGGWRGHFWGRNEKPAPRSCLESAANTSFFVKYLFLMFYPRKAVGCSGLWADEYIAV